MNAIPSYREFLERKVRMRTLNLQQTQKKREKHFYPLQINIVERLLRRYSNKGDLVFDPFSGLFTLLYCALSLGRRGRASELDPDYFADGVRYLVGRESEVALPTPFDLMTLEEGEMA